jgi:hypothetical protein
MADFMNRMMHLARHFERKAMESFLWNSIVTPRLETDVQVQSWKKAQWNLLHL